jgi:hypothetical protein
MKTAFTFLSFFLLSASVSFAQQPVRKCATMERLERLISQDPSIAVKMQQQETALQNSSSSHLRASSPQSTLVIPVVVHVVYKTTGENISDAQIKTQIDVLNKDYNRLNTDSVNTPVAFRPLAGKMNIQFRLALLDPNDNKTSGIVRYKTKTNSFSDNDAVKHFTPDSFGGADAWNTKKYLNIWVCNLDGGLLGYAQMPNGGSADEDGVVIHYKNFGTTTGLVNPPYHKGRTATHEVGHWLNLHHTWGDDFGSCSGSDYASDTPNQASETYGKPSYPQFDACTGSGNGIMFMNYMDYSDDDAMNMFSKGQINRMLSAMSQSPRADLNQDAIRLTGITANERAASAFSVYPNPSKGKISVKGMFGNDTRITVYNLIGQPVYINDLNLAGNGTAEIDLSRQPDGIYFTEISSSNIRTVHKTVLSR